MLAVENIGKIGKSILIHQILPIIVLLSIRFSHMMWLKAWNFINLTVKVGKLDFFNCHDDFKIL